MKPVFETPKIFISHGRAGDALNIFRSFLESLNFEVIVVINEPNIGRTLSEKVKSYLRESDCILVLATPDNKDVSSSAFQPRANVSHEIGFAEALDKKIIYLKHNDVDFGSNYSDKVWIPFSDTNYHEAFQLIIEEIKKFQLISFFGKLNKESVKSEITEKILKLIEILNVKDVKLKSNLLYNLAIALYQESTDLTKKELCEFVEFYPEYTQTCAGDGYKNENLYRAIQLLSFSLTLNPRKSHKIDYIGMLCDAYYIGEGTFDEDIKNELNKLLIEEARDGDLFQNELHISRVLFYLTIFYPKNREIFWGHLTRSTDVRDALIIKLKKMLFSIYQEGEMYTEYSPLGFPLAFTKIEQLNDGRLKFKSILENDLENSTNSEKQLIFQLLSKHFESNDISDYIEIIKRGNEDIVMRIIWILGENSVDLNTELIEIFIGIFESKNHKLIGLLATTLGKMKNRHFNNHLVEALNDFDFDSRRRIIWAMGEIGLPEFKDVLCKLEIDETNYALQETLSDALKKLSAAAY